MKTQRRITALAVTALLAVGMALNFSGCSKELSLGPEADETSKKQLNILAFGTPKSMAKIVEKSKEISSEDGGTIWLEHEFEDEDYEVEVEISLKFLPDALSDDAVIKLSIDDHQFLGNMDVVFNPHGIEFLKPAILNFEIEVEGYDPTKSDLHERDFNIYYDNPETGQWEPMPREAMEVELEYENGEYELEIEVINARLPHFSRYAIGSE